MLHSEIIGGLIFEAKHQPIPWRITNVSNTRAGHPWCCDIHDANNDMVAESMDPRVADLVVYLRNHVPSLLAGAPLLTVLAVPPEMEDYASRVMTDAESVDRNRAGPGWVASAHKLAAFLLEQASLAREQRERGNPTRSCASRPDMPCGYEDALGTPKHGGPPMTLRECMEAEDPPKPQEG